MIKYVGNCGPLSVYIFMIQSNVWYSFSLSEISSNTMVVKAYEMREPLRRRSRSAEKLLFEKCVRRSFLLNMGSFSLP